MTAKVRKDVTVLSVGFPGVILWHVTCPKLCRALPEASHFTCLWPGIINQHLALMPQKNLTVVLLRSFSESTAKKAVHRALGRIVSVCRYCALSPIFLLCFPSSLALHHIGYSPVHPSHAGIQCRCYQFLVLCGQVVDGRMMRRSTNVFCSVRSCHFWAR